MALMEYCLVNIVLGDSDMPPKPLNKKSFNFSFRSNLKLNDGHSIPPPPRPPPAATAAALAATTALAQRNRTRAINIDRFSRVFFPLLFAVLNMTYWVIFARFL
ncbi:unnamed protein product [Macrosiphum euphorbiae]|uniref:Uncharacterized protein n=2 Tax=Macrosiphum euphorbiae TaxID=13131 RepID=A0AAV0WNB2_9HEMI|nr:unnamed protein product [Macrosiphum euphorbiae]